MTPLVFRPLDAPDALARASAPCAVVGSTFAYFRVDDGLAGTLFQGSPTRDDLRIVVACWSAKIDHEHPTHSSIFDVTRLTAIDHDAFETIVAFVEHHRDALPARIARQALICPRTAPGATVAGFATVFPVDYPLEIHERLEDALASFGRDPALALDLDALLEGTSAELRALRARLRAPGALRDASLDTVARTIGCSARTLQRRLREGRTSFTEELTQARLELGKSLLAHQDDKLSTLARELGLASEQHLVRLFRERVGETPARLRLRLQRPDRGP